MLTAMAAGASTSAIQQPACIIVDGADNTAAGKSETGQCNNKKPKQHEVFRLDIDPPAGVGTVQSDLSFFGMESTDVKYTGRTEEVSSLTDFLIKMGDCESIPPFLTHTFNELVTQSTEDMVVSVIVVISKKSTAAYVGKLLRILRSINNKRAGRFYFWLADSQSREGKRVQEKYGVSSGASCTIFVLAPSFHAYVPQCVDTFDERNMEEDVVNRALAKALQFCGVAGSSRTKSSQQSTRRQNENAGVAPPQSNLRVQQNKNASVAPTHVQSNPRVQQNENAAVAPLQSNLRVQQNENAGVAPPQSNMRVQQNENADVAPPQSNLRMQQNENAAVTPPQSNLRIQQNKNASVAPTQSNPRVQQNENAAVAPPQSNLRIQQNENAAVDPPQSNLRVQQNENAAVDPPQSNLRVQQNENAAVAPPQSNLRVQHNENAGVAPTQSNPCVQQEQDTSLSSDNEVSLGRGEPSNLQLDDTVEDEKDEDKKNKKKKKKKKKKNKRKNEDRTNELSEKKPKLE